ncbi:MAG: hypothetical protein FWH59_02770 [Lentimicrobiaceae bacterium]|nr:hypothetical protein [Lentimicrobiaceae bacterium]
MKKHENLTWEDIKAMYAEIAEMQKETNLQMKETDRRFKETEKRFRETDKKFAETERIVKETSESIKRTEKMIENTNKQIGGISRSNGEFCEEYFINSFKENPTFMGEKYERVIDYLKPDPVVINDEYDLVLRNGSSVVIIEMKYKSGIDDVGKMFSKLHSYRANYPVRLRLQHCCSAAILSPPSYLYRFYLYNHDSPEMAGIVEKPASIFAKYFSSRNTLPWYLCRNLPES